jgi:hypothetical protein
MAKREAIVSSAQILSGRPEVRNIEIICGCSFDKIFFVGDSGLKGQWIKRAVD